MFVVVMVVVVVVVVVMLLLLWFIINFMQFISECASLTLSSKSERQNTG